LIADRLAAAVEAEVERGLEDLFASIRIPSVSARRQGLEESAEFLRDLLERDGWTAEIAHAGSNPIVYGEVGPATEPAILVYGHHDVQPPEPEAAWTSPPFEPVIRDGRIYARGSSDNKAQFFAHVFAVRALLREGDLKSRIKLVLDGEEEVGSPSIGAFVTGRRDRLRAAFCVTADGPARTPRPQVVFGVRGIVELRLTVRTSAGDLHSGNWGNLAPNAALRLAQILAEVKGLDGRVRVPGFYDGVRAPTELERKAMAQIPFDDAGVAASIGAAALDGPEDVPALERLMFWPTFNVTGITSGYTGPGFKTVLPAEATAQIDVRIVADQDPDRVYAVLRDHIAGIAPEARLEKLGHYLPSRTPLDSPYAHEVVDAVRAGFGEEPLLFPCAGGSSPEAEFSRALGVPAFHVPYGNPDQRNHGPDENMRLDYLLAGARTSAALFSRPLDQSSP
jgi:acetylornithine deacetylase/succinyl-diaminopimelate desuccinylase-like protein